LDLLFINNTTICTRCELWQLEYPCKQGKLWQLYCKYFYYPAANWQATFL